MSGTRPNADPRGPAGYSDEKSMSATLDLLREVGCKGFFVDGMAHELSQLDWLKHFKDKGWRDSEADYRPNVIDFPLFPATGAYVKQLTPNTWWLPTLRLGRTSYIGDGLQLYTLVGDDKSYLWSSGGDKTVTFKATSSGYPSIDFPPSATIAKQSSGNKNKKKNKDAGLFSITLTDVPVVLRGMDSNLIFPVETAATEVQRLADLISIADKAGISVKEARTSLASAKRVLANGPPVTAYGIAQASIGTLNQSLGSTIWIEGEESPANNFDGPMPIRGASRGLALVVDTDQDPPLVPYTAAFVANAPTNSSYEIWIAATPPADGSAISYNLDDGAFSPVAAVDNKLSSYAPGLAWYKIGTANLFPSKHTLKLRLDSRRSQDNRYYFAIDAVVLSPKAFTPNGVIKP